MNADDYARLWDSEQVSALQATLSPGTTPQEGARKLRAALGPRSGLDVQTCSGLASVISARPAARASPGLGSDRAARARLGGHRDGRSDGGPDLAAARVPRVREARGLQHRGSVRALVAQAALLVGAGCVVGAAFGLLGQQLLARALMEVTGFPVDYVLAWPNAADRLRDRHSRRRPRRRVVRTTSGWRRSPSEVWARPAGLQLLAGDTRLRHDRSASVQPRAAARSLRRRWTRVRRRAALGLARGASLAPACGAHSRRVAAGGRPHGYRSQARSHRRRRPVLDASEPPRQAPAACSRDLRADAGLPRLRQRARRGARRRKRAAALSRHHRAPSTRRRPLADYYRDHPWRDDGGFLPTLVNAFRADSTRLPAFDAIRPHLEREASRTCVLDANHTADPARRDYALRAWAASEYPSEGELHWFELTAAASGWITAHALLAVGAEPGVTSSDVDAVYAAYFPWRALSLTMPDSCVDEAEDLRGGRLQLLRSHEDREEGLDRLCASLERSANDILTLRHLRERHAVLLACMIAPSSARTARARAE